jgi:dipeptidyl aminopeptidase/acylaminoacyl peptidase
MHWHRSRQLATTPTQEMAPLVSRRAVLRSGGAFAALWLDGAFSSAAPTVPVSRRPFEWTDVYRRSQVERVALSPTGGVAVQVTRPMAAGGKYGGSSRLHIQPRGEIWLLSERLDRPVRLGLGDLWSWAPSFSPRGTRLAALVSSGDGRVGLVVWKLQDRRPRVFFGRNVDIYGQFSCDRMVEGQPSIDGDVPKQFAWLDEDTILFLEVQEQTPQFELDITSATRTYTSLWRRTAQGAESVRVWNDMAPVCGSGRSIAKIDCNTGDVETFYRGSVRGVSVAPNRRWLAALIALDHLKASPTEPMSPGLRYFAISDDPLVSLSLVRIDLTGELPAALMIDSCGVGAVAPRRLPIWASDSRSLAFPTRSIYSSKVSSGDDACWHVDADTLHAQRWRATSALDAELLAALLISAPRSEANAMVMARPQLRVSPETRLPVAQGQGSAWSYGQSCVALWDRTTITLMSPTGSKTLPGAYDAVYPPACNSRAAFQFAVRKDGQGCILRLSGLEFDALDVEFAPNYGYLGIRASDGTVIATEDADSGTSIMALMPGRRIQVSALAFNSHFRDVEKPDARELTYRAKDGTELTGVLQLPVGRSAGDRHPVILWAYPDQRPSVNDWLTRANSMMAVWRPIQYLLTRGFAVFHAPLPITMKSAAEPIDWVTQSVMPWLDILDGQPDLFQGEYGFFGHSNAGYVALALEAGTARFKAIVAYATFPDLGANALAGVPDKLATACGGQAIQADRFYYEDSTQPYGLGVPFWRDPQKFVRNSPLFRMQSASTPLLLLQGEFDYGPRAMESVFSILYGRGVPVELAYYWGEGHLINSPGNIQDMWRRTERFYRRYLKMTEGVAR